MIWPGISGYFCLSVCQCPSKQNLKSQSKLKNLIFIFKGLGNPLMKIVKSKNFFVLISYVFCIISFVLKRLYVNKQSFFLKEIFFVPRTWSGCYDQISEFFLLRKFGVVLVFILIYQGLNFGSTFIHPRFIHSEKRVDKIIFRPENIECKNPSDILNEAWVPYW